MKYAVTGGAGYIGSHLAKALLRDGHSVEVIDSLSAGSLSNLADINDKIAFHKTDIRNGSELNKILSGKDGIFHHAALTSVADSYENEQEYTDVNVGGTRNVFEAAAESGTKVVFASSAGVYGDTNVIPTPESADLKPANPYGRTKLEAEILAKKFESKTDIVGLRYYNVYGEHPENSSSGVISKFYQSVSSGKPPVIEGDGMQVRDFVFVNDVVRATILAMEKKTGTTFVNIGSGKATSILDLANMFIRYSKKDLRPVFEGGPEGNVRASQADISLARRLLGWAPEKKLVDWIEEIMS